MQKYIIITGDYNDGDYCTEKSKITEEEIIKIKDILNKMPSINTPYSSRIKYKTREIGNDDSFEDSDYNFISNEEKEFLDDFLPVGDQGSGIHTLESVEIIEVLEKIL